MLWSLDRCLAFYLTPMTVKFVKISIQIASMPNMKRHCLEERKLNTRPQMFGLTFSNAFQMKESCVSSNHRKKEKLGKAARMGFISYYNNYFHHETLLPCKLNSQMRFLEGVYLIVGGWLKYKKFISALKFLGLPDKKWHLVMQACEKIQNVVLYES